MSVALGLLVLAQVIPQEPPVDFQRQVRPILSDRCFLCHGPDAAARKADLRLDTQAGSRRDLGGYAAIVPGDASASELIRRITTDDDDDRMPPRHAKLELSPAEVVVLERWIDQGAVYTPHWAFEPPVAAEPPVVRDESWPQDPVDRFVLARLEARDLQPSPRASRHEWLRRVTFVLTGLPPTPEEVQAFVADDRAEAHEVVVDRLLASPHFGERMASPWLDLARYADTYGYQSDVGRRVWPYRDWVIQAYNDNLPYDDFLRWQLAGDLLPEATAEQRIATAFNRLHRQTNEGGSVEEEFRVEYVSDRVHTMGTAFLGLTLECARCHDHKFDPISQREYYQLANYFDDIDECGLYSHFTSATPTPAMNLPSAQQEQALAVAEAAVAQAERAVAELAQGAAVDASAVDWLEAHLGDGAVRGEQGRFAFDEARDGGFPDSLKPERLARPEGAWELVPGIRGQALRLQGDDGVRFPEVGQFRRSEPFTVAYCLKVEEDVDRAILLHRTKSWTDAGSQGWQFLLDEGRLLAALVHFWPGDMIAIRTQAKLPLDTWVHIGLSYDGSSRVSGLRLFLDGVEAEIDVVMDSLTRGITGGGPGNTGFGARFRDRGFSQGALDEVRFFERELVPAEMRAVAVAAREASPNADSLTTPEEPGDRAMHPDAVAQPEFVEALGRLREARRKRDDLRDRIPQMMVMQQSAQPRQARILHRGHYDQPKEEVALGVPTMLGAEPTEEPGDRLELADWLLAEGHPLTARVEVDRLWRVVFGRGLVATPEDFGSQGAEPPGRQLLDWLAVAFRKSGWDRKAMLRRLALSATFAQTSSVTPDLYRIDPENELLARGPSSRLTAEMLRDAALAVSGLLVRDVGGPSVRPYQPPGLWQEKSGHKYQPSKGKGLYRRSLYTYWKRTSPPPSMMILDAAKRDVCSARRQSTNTPLQPLVRGTDPLLAGAAGFLGAGVLLAWPPPAPGEVSDEQRVLLVARDLFLRAAGRPPRDEEVEAILNLWRAEYAALGSDPDRAEAIANVGEAPAAEGLDRIEHASWSIVGAMLLASEPVVTLR
ncbi:MAG: DUF1549 domain-containing protein [Planctomycetota bacterium]|nr:DUF1549 domain-containing protein [Planctomycetota bacterium]